MSTMAMPESAHAAHLVGKERSWISVLVLSLLTLGIYGLYWQVVTLEDIKRHGGVGPGGLGVLLYLIPGAALVFLFLIPSWIGELNRLDGQEPDTTAATGFWLFLPIVGGCVWFARSQNTLNRHWRSHS